MTDKDLMTDKGDNEKIELALKKNKTIVPVQCSAKKN